MEKCRKMVYGKYTFRECARPARVEVDGKWYCGWHDPIRIQKNKEFQLKKWADQCAKEKEK